MISMSITGRTQPQTRAREGSESDLVKMAQQDIKAFEKLYSKYYEPILRFVYQRVNTKDEAYDVTSQVFLKAMTKINQYEDRGLPFSSWLYRIARSEVSQFYRDQKKQPALSIDENQLTQLAADVVEKDVIIANEQLISWLAELPDDDLPYIEMRYLEERSFKEIGEILNITENNAKVKTHRIIGRLRKRFVK